MINAYTLLFMHGLLFKSFNFFLFFFFEMGFLFSSSPGWPPVHRVAKDDVETPDAPASTSQVLGLYVCTTVLA